MKEQNGTGNEYTEEQAQRTAYLIAGYLQQTLSESEHDELDEWVGASDANMLLFEQLTDKNNIEQGLKELKGYNTQKAIERIRKKIHSTSAAPTKRSRNYWPLSIAASLLLIAGILVFKNYSAKTPKPIAEKQDLLPGGNKATLTLSDGSVVNLTDAKNGLVKNETGAIISKTADGQLAYSGTENNITEIKYNTLITPKGGQYMVVLPDGTRAWLNAASSLKYPVAFAGTERVVELTGEGYFEVAKDTSRHFKMKLQNDVLVEVTGTHFNINSYADEEATRVTLLEGSVRVGSQEPGAGSPNEVILKPGQQAALTRNSKPITLNSVNLDEVVAWKNGLFQFRNQSIETIMRQVGRWYDVDIVYEGNVPDHFNITGMPRDVTVSKLFKLLEMTGRVHFSIEGKKIIVKP